MENMGNGTGPTGRTDPVGGDNQAPSGRIFQPDSLRDILDTAIQSNVDSAEVPELDLETPLFAGGSANDYMHQDILARMRNSNFWPGCATPTYFPPSAHLESARTNYGLFGPTSFGYFPSHHHHHHHPSQVSSNRYSPPFHPATSGSRSSGTSFNMRLPIDPGPETGDGTNSAIRTRSYSRPPRSSEEAVSGWNNFYHAPHYTSGSSERDTRSGFNRKRHHNCDIHRLPKKPTHLDGAQSSPTLGPTDHRTIKREPMSVRTRAVIKSEPEEAIPGVNRARECGLGLVKKEEKDVPTTKSEYAGSKRNDNSNVRVKQEGPCSCDVCFPNLGEGRKPLKNCCSSCQSQQQIFKKEPRDGTGVKQEAVVKEEKDNLAASKKCENSVPPQAQPLEEPMPGPSGLNRHLQELQNENNDRYNKRGNRRLRRYSRYAYDGDDYDSDDTSDDDTDDDEMPNTGEMDCDLNNLTSVDVEPVNTTDIIRDAERNVSGSNLNDSSQAIPLVINSSTSSVEEVLNNRVDSGPAEGMERRDRSNEQSQSQPESQPRQKSDVLSAPDLQLDWVTDTSSISDESDVVLIDQQEEDGREPIDLTNESDEDAILGRRDRSRSRSLGRSPLFERRAFLRNTSPPFDAGGSSRTTGFMPCGSSSGRNSNLYRTGDSNSPIPHHHHMHSHYRPRPQYSPVPTPRHFRSFRQLNADNSNSSSGANARRMNSWNSMVDHRGRIQV